MVKEDDDTLMVDNCTDGQIEVPYWVRSIQFWKQLCTKPVPRVTVIDFGTSLAAEGEVGAGDVIRYQVYYSLMQVRVPPMKRQLVWSVCGGDGMVLPELTEVVPGGRLPRAQAQEIARIVTALQSYEKGIKLAHDLMLNPAIPQPQLAALRIEYQQRMDVIDQEANLLRDAIMTNNQKGLALVGMPMKGFTFHP